MARYRLGPRSETTSQHLSRLLTRTWHHACIFAYPEGRPEAAGAAWHMGNVGNEKAVGPCCLACYANRLATGGIAGVQHARVVDAPARSRARVDESITDCSVVVDIVSPAVGGISCSEEVKLIEEG